MEESIQIDKVYARHFEKARKAVTPRITEEMIAFYDEFRNRSGLRSI